MEHVTCDVSGHRHLKDCPGMWCSDLKLLLFFSVTQTLKKQA